jgi:hypothetical protein
VHVAGGGRRIARGLARRSAVPEQGKLRFANARTASTAQPGASTVTPCADLTLATRRAARARAASRAAAGASAASVGAGSEEDESNGRRRERAGRVEARTEARSADVRCDVGPDGGLGGAVGVEEGGVAGAARQGLEAERAGAGEAVEHGQASKLPRRETSMEKSVSRARSEVGRVAWPAGAAMGRPRQAPAMMRIR